MTRRAFVGLLGMLPAMPTMAAGTRRQPALAQAADGSGTLTVGAPRVEWRAAPLGIDTRRPRFSWKLGAREEHARGLRQGACAVRVASRREALEQGRADIWDSGPLRGELAHAVPDRDLALLSQCTYWWSARSWDHAGASSRWSEPAAFVTGIVPGDAWHASWIAATADGPPTRPARASDPNPHAAAGEVLPLFRRDFVARRAVRRATVSVSGLGQYALSINGRTVNESVLDPGWTDYRRTVLYNTYDATALLREGANTLGVMLGNGMYRVEGVRGRYTKFVGSFGQPKLILRMDIEYDDGSRERIVSDRSWRTRPGPIVFSSIYGGEDVDLRRETIGWDRPGALSGDWTAAIEVGGPGGQLKAQGVPPVVVAKTFAPVAVSEPKPGVFVYDFGENFSGRPSLVLRGGTAGRTVRLTPGEALADDGLVSQSSYHAKPDFATYFSVTLRDDGEQPFRPRFTYHGFRYLQVDGAVPKGHEANGIPVIQSLQGEFLYDDLPATGSFDSSDTLLVRIHKLIERAMLSNAFSVLTDCPHREKLGWLEQTHLNADTVLYNRDAITLYEKMIGDIVDAQQPNGLVPEIAPEFIAFVDRQGADTDFRDSPEWGCAVVLSPWAAYRMYGDAKILAEGYDAMRRYLEHLESRAHDGILDYGLGDWYDIGPKGPGEAQLTAKAVTATGLWYESLVAMVSIARLLGRPAGEIATWDVRAARVREAFNRHLFDDATNRYDRGSQTACAIPLALGLVPPGREQAVLEQLVADIRARDNSVSAGDIGFHYVVRALTAYDRGDVLLAMLSVTDRPSYGYQLARGMTALTEAWDANPTKSLNHFMLGHAESWLYGGLGGVRVDFARGGDVPAIRIAPQAVDGVERTEVRYASVLGEIASAWQRQGARLHVQVSVPPGARAIVVVPTKDVRGVREGGLPLDRAKGVLAVAATPGHLEVTLGSGTYRFDSALAVG
jgi:hypothetical protein